MSETPGSKILGYFAMHYEGVYIPGQDYTFLSLVIYAGGLWLCIKKTGTVNVDPGSNDEVWVLSSTSAATAEYLDVINTLHGLDDSFDTRLQQANDAKSAAEAAKTEALGSASQAAGSAQAAQIDKDAAQVAAGQAQISANEAAGSANDANASKLAAQSAAGSAQGSATAAAESESAAESAMAGAQEAQAAAEQTAANFEGIVNLVGAGNPNLLHNWDFRNPVNQRGVSGAISSGTYFYDRWVRNNGTVTVNANYLTISAGGVITQRIEGLWLSGRIVTVSLLLSSGGILQGSGTFTSTAGEFSTIAISGFGDVHLGISTGTHSYIGLFPTASVNIAAIKLELGTVSTLHLDPPMDYGTELAKCQRYCKVFNASYRFYGVSHWTGGAVATLICPAALRVAPSYTAPEIGWRGNGLSGTCTLFNATIVSGGLELSFSSSANNLPTAHVCQFEFNEKIVFSADL